jgi:anaerobic selenocysteine-containing dehydrogenase
VKIRLLPNMTYDASVAHLGRLVTAQVQEITSTYPLQEITPTYPLQEITSTYPLQEITPTYPLHTHAHTSNGRVRGRLRTKGQVLSG